jgi:4-amino-4-deoxy-L-arabinose transferase-like glycosyltransferase
MKQSNIFAETRLTRADAVWMVLLLVAGGGWRTLCAWLYAIPPSGDYGIVGLMAKHMLEAKEWPVFFYGQSYMGTAEPFVSSLFCRLMGPTGFAVNLGTVVCGLLIIPTCYIAAHRIAGRVAGVIAGLLVMIGNLWFDYYIVSPRGGYALTLSLIPIILFWSASISAREFTDNKAHSLSYLFLGLIAGLAWWTSQMITAVLLTSALLFIPHLLNRRFCGQALLGVAGFFIGSAPWWIWNLQNDMATFTFFNAMDKYSGRVGLGIMAMDMLPRLLDFRYESLVAWTWPSSVSAIFSWAMYAVYGAGLLGAALLLVKLLFDKTATTKNLHATFFTLAAFLAMVLFVLLACRSAFLQTKHPRYLLPLVPPAAVLTGAGLAYLRTLRGGRWVAGAGVAILMINQLQHVYFPFEQSRGLIKKTAELTEALRRALPDLGVTEFYADFMRHGWLNFALGEQVTIANLPGDRYEPYAWRLEQSDRPGIFNDYGGAVTFALNSGGTAFTKEIIPELSVTYGFSPSTQAVRQIQAAAWADAWLEASHDASSKLVPVLTDGKLQTFLDRPLAHNETVGLVIQFKQPESISRVVFISPDAQYYPGAWQVEGRNGAHDTWKMLTLQNYPYMFIWSGPRFYWSRQMFHARMDFAPTEVSEIRIVATGQGQRSYFSPSEVMLYAPADPSASAAASLDDLLATLAEWDIHRLYAERWVANQVAARKTNLWVSAERYHWGHKDISMTDDEYVKFGFCYTASPRNALLHRVEDAEAARAIFARREIALQEKSIGPWVLMRPDPAVPIPPLHDLGMVWGGFRLFLDGLTPVENTAQLLRKYQKLTEEEKSSAVVRRFIRSSLRTFPNHPKLVEILALDARLDGDMAEAARLDARYRQLNEVTHPFAIGFDRKFRITGLTMEEGPYHPGQHVRIRYFWFGLEHPDRPTAFVHVKRDGALCFQDDFLIAEGISLNEGRLINRDGNPVSHEHTLVIPPDAAPGDYDIYMGAWYPEYQRRCRVATELPHRWGAVKLPFKLTVVERTDVAR